MENHQINSIRQAFQRCKHLRDGIREGGEMQTICLESLSAQTGISIENLENNLSIIENLQ